MRQILPLFQRAARAPMRVAPPPITHEGGPTVPVSPLEELRRSTLACLLWEDGFYESGEKVAERIRRLVPLCPASEVAALAIEARERDHLRHVPLLLVRELVRHPAHPPVADLLARVIRRPDELTEFLAIYWAEGRTPLARQVKKGLARAFTKFNEHQLAKYNRDAPIQLRDVLFLVHARPKDDEQAALWKRLADGTLAKPDTWEVALSAGADKCATFERLLREDRLGYLALLRNLRNMRDAGVDPELVGQALRAGAARSKALPFRFVAAAWAVPEWVPLLDEAMQMALAGFDPLPDSTVLLVDVSGSMGEPLSARSGLSRRDAAAGLAVLLRALCADCRIFTFSSGLVEVSGHYGLALANAIAQSQAHLGTHLGRALEEVRRRAPDTDRLIVITDEQSADPVGPPIGRGYMINVSVNQTGIGYGPWMHINGFSEAVVQYIAALERLRAGPGSPRT